MAGNNSTTKPSFGEIVIEIANRHNRPLLFGPTSERLRPRWDTANVIAKGRHPHESMQGMPILAGIHVSVDAEKRLCRRYDPLKETEEGRATWKRAQAIMALYQYAYKKMEPWDAVANKDCDETTIKTWLYAMRRAVDAGHAVVVSGNLPTLEQIALLPGKTAMGHFNTMTTRSFFREDEAARQAARYGQPVSAA